VPDDRTHDETESRATSADAIVPLIVGLIGPRSVLDVGHGDGTWLGAYRRAGVADCVGVDAVGSRTPVGRFPRDFGAPFALGRRFDLVQSLAVADRLPAAFAESFVRSLTGHGDAVLFSAAVPHSGGPDGRNEQWPDYWADLFRRAGFATYDWLRPRVWRRARGVAVRPERAAVRPGRGSRRMDAPAPPTGPGRPAAPAGPPAAVSGPRWRRE
jgi:hypothetical protein